MNKRKIRIHRLLDIHTNVQYNLFIIVLLKVLCLRNVDLPNTKDYMYETLSFPVNRIFDTYNG